ncbi:MAG: phosphatidylserine decarboxylase [Acutalibacteraceae bacterium]|jgi:phosphatidylserine decarboxylase
MRPTVRATETGALRFLYKTAVGRCLLKGMVRPAVSRLAGRFLDSRLSRPLIGRFIRQNGVDLGEYVVEDWRCFNAFFTRRIRPGRRPFDPDPTHLCAPCDSKLSVYPLNDGAAFTIKGSPYTAAELLDDPALADAFGGGWCLIFRLTVDDYHRYAFFDDGAAGKTRFIPGVLHTVQPIALSHANIYKRNCRAVTVLRTAHFADAAQVEVGALLVGRIVNRPVDAFKRGEEKGRFEYGGSTVVLLLKKGVARIDEELLQNTRDGLETVVKMGEKIGIREDRT